MEVTTNYGWSMPEPTDPVNSSAEYAENMELIDGVVKDIADEVDAVDSGLTALATTVAGKVNKAGDTMTGALNMGGSKIQNVATPTAGSDAATKAYVDNIATADSIKKDGSVTFEADQSMGGHKLTGLPTSGSYNAGDAIPKQYVTDNAVTYAEGLTSDLNANNNTITALGTPTFNYDAATKKYVDDTVSAIDGFLPITGGDMEGDIDMKDNNLVVSTIMPQPGSDIEVQGRVDFNNFTASGLTRLSGLDTDFVIDESDAATKGYVDSKQLDFMETNEIDTGIKWKNNKTIYRKNITGSVSATTSFDWKSISFTGFDECIFAFGKLITDTTSTSPQNFPFPLSTNNRFVTWNYGATNILYLGISWDTPKTVNYDIWVFYTK